MSVYLDASFLLPLFVVDAHTQRARAYLKGLLDDLIVSNFAAAEFASGIARLVRMSELDANRVPEVFDSFDYWTGQSTERVDLLSSDVKEAEHLLRSLTFRLTTPDVLTSPWRGDLVQESQPSTLRWQGTRSNLDVLLPRSE